jgi:thymidylate kinase
LFTIALIGPDGAGKTSVARRLASLLPMPVEYVYMGVNPDSSSHMLPTTRLVHGIKRARGAPPDKRGPRDSTKEQRRPRGFVKRTLRGMRSTLRLANRLAEEWHRQLVAQRHVRRGAVVVFDRHFFADFYAYDVSAPPGVRRSLARRLHGLVLARLYPRPDLVFYLDAPAETLFARKGEGTLETLERRRGEYLDLQKVLANFVVVDAARPVDDVAAEVAEVVLEFSAARGKDTPVARSPVVP